MLTITFESDLSSRGRPRNPDGPNASRMPAAAGDRAPTRVTVRRAVRALVVATVFGTVTAGAQDAPPASTGRSAWPPAGQLSAVRTSRAPTIDGRDDDAMWAAAPAEGAFRVFAPHEGDEPALRTETRVLYDDRALYVLVRAYGPAPDSIVRRLARRDTFDATADQVLTFLDSYHDRRSGYEFVVTAGGVKTDAALANDVDEDYSWDGVWDAATRVDSLGWVAEFAIPLRQLRYTSRSPTFGLLIGRWVGRSGERMSVPQYRRSRAGLVSQLGDLVGLRDLAPSGSVEATPYLLTRAQNLAGVADRGAHVRTQPQVGGDLKWVPRPSVSLDATVNPDFGQVDADPAVLNLSGLEVFQTERRPFFLEGAGLLALPRDASGSSQLFYSRRIGRRPALLDVAGDPASPTETVILGAAKVTAHLGPATSLAALSAVTGRADGAPRFAGAGRA